LSTKQTQSKITQFFRKEDNNTTIIANDETNTNEANINISDEVILLEDPSIDENLPNNETNANVNVSNEIILLEVSPTEQITYDETNPNEATVNPSDEIILLEVPPIDKIPENYLTIDEENIEYIIKVTTEQ